jgi:hypothetical protein
MKEGRQGGSEGFFSFPLLLSSFFCSAKVNVPAVLGTPAQEIDLIYFVSNTHHTHTHIYNMYTHMYTHTHTHRYVRAHVHTYTCMCTHIYIYIYIYIYICVCIYMCVCVCICICVYIYMCVCVCICICVYTCIEGKGKGLCKPDASHVHTNRGVRRGGGCTYMHTCRGFDMDFESPQACCMCRYTHNTHMTFWSLESRISASS